MMRKTNQQLFLRTVLWTMGLLSFSFNGFAQLDEDYFAQLQSARVESSDVVEWTQIGPGMSGYCEEFWCHPTNANVMFMSPDMYNSYGSWDNGVSWQTIKDCDGTGVFMRRVQSITFSHQNENFALAIDVRGYLYASDDMGHSWTKMKEMGGRHSELAVDPSDDNNWYMGAGDFWNVKSHVRKSDIANNYVYKYAEYGHIYKSTDKGQSWKKVTTGLPSTLDVGKIIVDPRNSNNIAMIATDGFYQSTDMGESWTKNGADLPVNRPRDMGYYYDKASGEYILYLLDQTAYDADGQTTTSRGGVFKSSDGGTHWTSITGNLALNLQAVTNWNARDQYHNTIANWLGITKANAKSTYPTYPTEVLQTFNRLVVNPTNKDELYLSHNVKHDRSFGPGDVYKTADGGSHWIAAARTGAYWVQRQDARYWNARSNPMGMNTSYAHLQHEQEQRIEVFGNRFMAINKLGEVFICLEQQVMRSNDNGESWQQVDDNETQAQSNAWVGRGASNLPGRFIQMNTGTKGSYLFCSGEHGLWQTAPLGTYADKKAIALRQIEGQTKGGDAATSIATVAVHPNNPNIIYTLQFRQDHRCYFRRSTDGGSSWQNVSRPIDHEGNASSDMMFQFNLLIDPTDPNIIYFTLISNAISEVSAAKFPESYEKTGVYKSTDAGVSWTRENTGFPSDASVRRIKMDPDNSSILYAALNEGRNGGQGGLYKTTDKGLNWSKMTIPSDIVAVNNLHIDAQNKDLFIACGRYEGTLAEGGVWRSKDQGATWTKIFDMPYIWQCETSPVNADIIMVNAAMPHDVKGAVVYNPGAYLSKDAGATWAKINRNLGQPNTITDLRPDAYVEGVYWCALKGSGWAIGYDKTMNTGWYEAISTSISEREVPLKRLVISPNPVSDSIVLNLAIGTYRVQCFDGAGRCVKDLSYDATLRCLDVSDLNSGNYLLKVTGNSTQYSGPFMKL